MFSKKYYLAIFLLSLMGGALGLFYTQQFPVSYEASQTFFVKRQTAGPSRQFYTYDGYYSAQAAERFADSLNGFLKSQEVLRFLLARNETFAAGPRTALAQIAAGVKVRRLSPQLISFSYRGGNLESVKLVVEEIAQGLSKLSADLSRGGDEGLSLGFIDGQPQVLVRSQSHFLNGLVGALLGVFAAIAFFLLWDYLSLVKHD